MRKGRASDGGIPPWGPEMRARVIDGAAIAAALRCELRERIVADRRPGLAVVLVGDDPASAIYVRNKIRACEEVGIASFSERMPAHASEAEVLGLIERFNRDPA